MAIETNAGERLLKAREVAEMLDLEVGTVLDHFETGDLPGFRLYGRKGGPVRFRLSDIERVLEEWHVGTVSSDNRNGPAAKHRPGPGTGGISSHARRTLRVIDRDE